MTILDQLADYARERTEQAKRKIPLEKLNGRHYTYPKEPSLLKTH